MGDDMLKGALDKLQQGAKRVANAARTASREGGGQVNIATRKNVVVAGTTGNDSSSHSTSAEQTVRIRQNGREIRSEVNVPDPSPVDDN